MYTLLSFQLNKLSCIKQLKHTRFNKFFFTLQIELISLLNSFCLWKSSMQNSILVFLFFHLYTVLCWHIVMSIFILKDIDSNYYQSMIVWICYRFSLAKFAFNDFLTLVRIQLQLKSIQPFSLIQKKI